MHSIYQNNQKSPLIMGILNITPDSFSDGSQYNNVAEAFKRAKQMQLDGADILDVGGESTRPGAAEVSAEEEINRVIPVIMKIKTLGLPVSVDTSKPEVMRAAVEAGASMINDVRALQNEGCLATAAALKVPICLMHMQGQPRSMQNSPNYANVVSEVIDFLHQRVKACENAGIDRRLISLDPGFGFGKSLQHNLQLLQHLDRFNEAGLPVLAGLSRKSMLGLIIDKPIAERLSASLAAGLIAMQHGAQILRVHDVAETNDVRQVFMAMKALES